RARRGLAIPLRRCRPTGERPHRRADDALQRRAGTALRLLPAHELAAARRALDPRAGGLPESPRGVGRRRRGEGRMSQGRDSDGWKVPGQTKARLSTVLDAYVFAKQPGYDERAFRRSFARAVPLRTVVVYCYDPRAVGIPAAVAKEFGDVFPGAIVRDDT